MLWLTVFAALQKATYIEQTLNLPLSFQISQAGALFATHDSPEIHSLRDTQLIIDHPTGLVPEETNHHYTRKLFSSILLT